MTPNYFDQIDDYILNRLTVSDKVLFEQAMSLDTDLKKEVDANLQIRNLIHLESDHLLEQQIEENARKYEASTTAQSPKLYKWLTLALAGLTVALALYFMFNKSVDPTELYMASYEKPIVSFSSRSADEIVNPELSLIGQAYQQNEFDKALVAIVQIPLSNQGSKLKFAKAICLHETDQSEAALEILDQLVNSKDPLYDEAAQWYSAMIYLSKGNVIAASPLLNSLAKNKMSTYRTDAQRLLDQLK